MQVHPGLTVNIKAHTQSPTDTHTPMHVSWTKTPPSKPANTVVDARTQSHVMAAADPAAALNQPDDSSRSTGQATAQSSGPSDRPGSDDESSIGVLQQHLQNATAKSISGATEALMLIQPALGLQPNSSANSSLLDMPSASSSQPEDLSGSSQVHMGFNHSVIHDSSESNDFASVNGTDVIPISEMPDVDRKSHETLADWAQEVQTLASDGTGPLAPSALPASLSASSAASYTTAPHAHDDITRPLSTLRDNSVLPSEEAFYATQSTDPTPVSGNRTDVDSVPSSTESLRVEELSPEVVIPDESTWVPVDPYSDNLQGMIHPTSRMFRAPGK